MDNEQYLTHLGRLLASLPVHPLVGKILVYGALFRVIEPVAVIAASLTTKSAFILPGDRRSDADLDRRFLGQERQSDHYAQWQAYRGWEGAVRQGYERHYCDQHYLSMTVLQMIKRTKGQFIQTLLDSGFVKGTEKDKVCAPPLSLVGGRGGGGQASAGPRPSGGGGVDVRWGVGQWSLLRVDGNGPRVGAGPSPPAPPPRPKGPSSGNTKLTIGRI